ncbi:hypothetical protein GJ496_002395 [Pomphorhynchus laevis]|nr:hypothetical protein GJ496_002395 [Pomphorhynchus laevis]
MSNPNFGSFRDIKLQSTTWNPSIYPSCPIEPNYSSVSDQQHFEASTISNVVRGSSSSTNTIIEPLTEIPVALQCYFTLLKRQADMQRIVSNQTSASFMPIFDFNHQQKPALSYIGLIAMAILESPEHKLVLSDIYKWIILHYPYFRSRGSGWRNSVRHNLSLNECFIKNGRSTYGKGHFWSINPQNLAEFQRGNFRRRNDKRLRTVNTLDLDKLTEDEGDNVAKHTQRNRHDSLSSNQNTGRRRKRIKFDIDSLLSNER